MLGELQIDAKTAVVILHGELDMLTVEPLRRLLAEACVSDPTRVIVDISDVPFIDVLSLSAILAAADALRERGAALLVAGASGSVRRICALLNAKDILAPALPTPRLATG